MHHAQTGQPTEKMVKLVDCHSVTKGYIQTTWGWSSIRAK